ncbi:hypothetical protein FNV43_RR00723 [Rhamnella rubrinervis]|uniref:Pentatricopeptide repeat-containing protein n=1 Tax=Rhamnella rubrinervis TaxID=2594499 RepID=A0A8K0MSP0_9ROSA|nr:hypothetical protein FNV43_RR00723 [Rhamnella rubrinervis]
MVSKNTIEEGDMNDALRIKERMVEYCCLCTNVTVNILINGFCKECRIEKALGFLQEMANEGFRPDWFTYTTLVNGLCKTGHVKHALEIMDVMLQEGFDPDTFTCNSLIFGLRKLGEVKDAIFKLLGISEGALLGNP